MKKVFFNRCDGFSEIAITVDGIMEHFYRLKDGFITGSIFVGKVKFVKKQMGIFVDISLGKDGIIPYREGLKPGDNVVVMATREETKDKGCALTEKVTLAGRFAVLNDVGEIRFSRNISEGTKINLFTIHPREGIGFIFRSACENADFKEIADECEILTKKYDEIQEMAKNTSKICCLYSDDAESVARRFSETGEVFFGLEEIKDQIKTLGERKVYRDGVELVFDKTEAMTVVDVNMHKYNREFADPDIKAFNANVLAVKEFCRQIRLRNIGGIIMVDFISFKNKEYSDKLKDVLIEELKADNVKTSVELVKSTGMFAVVRTVRYSAV